MTKITTKPYMNNAPVPDCNNCIAYALCKSHLSTCTNYDESLLAIDDLTNKCSILFDYVTDNIYAVEKDEYLPGTSIRSFFTTNEERAIEVFETIIPRK